MPQTASAENAALIGDAPPETRKKIRVVHIVLIVLTIGAVLTTVISAIVFHSNHNSLIANSFFAVTLSLIVISQGVMLYWYFRGGLEPKFRYYLYYSAFCTMLVCIAGNLYYHVGPPCTCPDCP